MLAAWDCALLFRAPMRSQPLTAPAGNSTNPFPSTSPDRDNVAARICRTAAALREEVSQASGQVGATGRADLRRAIGQLAGELTALTRPNRHDAWVADVLSLV